jgi:hypothetical protein
MYGQTRDDSDGDCSAEQTQQAASKSRAFLCVVPIMTCLNVIRSSDHVVTSDVATTVAARGPSYMRASSPNPMPVEHCTHTETHAHATTTKPAMNA